MRTGCTLGAGRGGARRAGGYSWPARRSSMCRGVFGKEASLASRFAATIRLLSFPEHTRRRSPYVLDVDLHHVAELRAVRGALDFVVEDEDLRPPTVVVFRPRLVTTVRLRSDLDDPSFQRARRGTSVFPQHFRSSKASTLVYDTLSNTNGILSRIVGWR